MTISAAELQLLQAIQAGLPLVPEPYRAVAERLGWSEEQVLERVQALLDAGVIRRLGAVPHHYNLGIRANGMCVWDIPDHLVDEVGVRLGCHPEVSHCYRRPRHRPQWPYNLFAMVHGRTRAEVRAKVADIRAALDLNRFPHDILFSRRLLKKTGVRL